MTEIISIGRVFDGYEADVSAASWSGGTLTLAGDVMFGTTSNRVDIAKAMRDRINALAADQDELAVAVRWTEDSTIDGFYRPTASTAAFDVASLNDGVLHWTVDLVRAGGATLPQCEVYGMHALRVNPHSITTATLNGSVPDILKSVPGTVDDFWAGVSPGVYYTRTASSGAVTVIDTKQQRNSTVTSTFTVPVASHYVGACSIRGTYGSATSQLVGGRWTPATWSSVVLSNDLVRVSQRSGASTNLYVEVYDGSAWEPVGGATSTGWVVKRHGSSTVTIDWAGASVDVLRNSPERCDIRLVPVTDPSLNEYGRTWLDLSVRRGARHVEGLAQCDTIGSSLGHFSVAPSSSIASTALTGGMRQTSDDAFGNRSIVAIAGGNSATNDTTTGSITQVSSSTQMPFMIGSEIAGSGAATPDTAQLVLYEYFDVHSETQRIVRR